MLYDVALFPHPPRSGFNSYVRGQLSVDELLLQPRAALNFCDIVRATHGYFDLPDDIILRTVMNRRKSPADKW